MQDIYNIKNKLSIMILSEGLAGTENQCIGVANALPQNLIKVLDIKQISLRQPWKSLSPYLKFEQRWTFTPPLDPPYPDILICAGRKAISAARHIKKESQGKTFVTFLQDPRHGGHNFDLIAVPEHDSLRGDNVIKTKGSPNKINADAIENAKLNFPHLKTNTPSIAVLIGGNSKAFTFSQARAQQIASQLFKLNVKIMLTFSRRTPNNIKAIFTNALPDSYIWDGTGNNPYFAMLGYADYILVTADSASMISEGATTGKPVYILDLDGGKKRIRNFHDTMTEYGAVRIFNGSLEKWSYPPLNDAQKVADEILRRLPAHLQKHT